MKKIEDIDIINYIINKGATAKEVADYYGVSLSTIKKRLASIKDELKDDSEIKNSLLNIISVNQEKGRHTGGLSNNSGKKRNVDITFIVDIAINALANNLTMEELSCKYSIPTSTISDYFKLLKNTENQTIYDDLTSLFNYHKNKFYITNSVSLFALQQKYSNMLKSDDEKDNKNLR